MTKKRTNKHARSIQLGKTASTTYRRPLLGIGLAVGLVLVVLAASWFLGRQPRLVVWLLGLLCAAAATAIYYFGTHEPDREQDEMAMRMRRGQHPDFGRRLRAPRKEPRKVTLPVFGTTTVRTIVASALFLAVLAWWLTPWAPVAVALPEPEDLSAPLTAELLAVVLVMPDLHLATAQPPILPRRAKKLAAEVREDAGAFHLAQKAIAEGRFDDARHLLQSLSEGEEVEPVDVHIARGQADLYGYRFAEALDAFHEALRLRPADPTVLCLAGVAAIHAGRFKEAESHIGVVLRAAEQSAATDATAAEEALQATIEHLRAVLCTIHGSTAAEFDEAQQLYQHVKESQQKDEVLGKRHPYFAATLNNQAIFNQLRAEYHGVQVMHSEAWNTWRSALGEKHPHVAASRGNLAVFYCLQSRYDDAHRCNADADQIRREVVLAEPRLRPLLALSMATTSLEQQILAHYTAARHPAEEALKIFRGELGPEHPNVAACGNLVASLYADGAQYTTLSFRHYHAAEAIVTKTLGADHPYRAVTLDKQAALHLAQRQNEPARKTAEQALAIAEAAYGPEHVVVAAIRGTLGRVAIAEGNFAQARFQFKRAIPIAEKIFGQQQPDHPLVARLLFGMASLLADQEDYEGACPLLERALRMQEKTLGDYQPNHPELARTMTAYAAVLRKLQPPQTKKADELEARAAQIRTKHATQGAGS